MPSDEYVLGYDTSYVRRKNNSDALFSHAVEVARKHGLISKGDIVVITAGIPLGISGTTNMLKVERIK